MNKPDATLNCILKAPRGGALFMKRKLLICICIVTAAGVLWGYGKVRASGSLPGSAADPLVSKSYVDEKFGQLLSMLNGLSQDEKPYVPDGADSAEIINEVMRRVDALLAERGEQPQTDTYAPVFAKRGQIITGGEGSEIILRSGSAIGYVTGENGVSDITSGTEILNGMQVFVNHLLIVPRSDGRGVRLTADSWFLIKGSYTIIG